VTPPVQEMYWSVARIGASSVMGYPSYPIALATLRARMLYQPQYDWALYRMVRVPISDPLTEAYRDEWRDSFVPPPDA